MHFSRMQMRLAIYCILCSWTGFVFLESIFSFFYGAALYFIMVFFERAFIVAAVKK